MPASLPLGCMSLLRPTFSLLLVIIKKPPVMNLEIVVVFFTLTDRASTIPSNIRGCQPGTWSAGQKKIRGTSTKEAPMRAKEKHKHTKNDKEKGTGITKYTCQKKIDEGHSIERVWHSALP